MSPAWFIFDTLLLIGAWIIIEFKDLLMSRRTRQAEKVFKLVGNPNGLTLNQEPALIPSTVFLTLIHSATAQTFSEMTTKVIFKIIFKQTHVRWQGGETFGGPEISQEQL